MTIIVCDPDEKWCSTVVKTFMQLNEPAQGVQNGKDCQLKIFQNKCECLILDLATEKHSALEVLKYVRINYPGVKVILTVIDPKTLEDMGMTPEDAGKLEIAKILVKPYTLDDIITAKNEALVSAGWIDILDTDDLVAGEQFSASNDEFTRINFSNFSYDKNALFDIFIRMTTNTYVKVLGQGNKIERAKLNKFMSDKNTNSIYFKTHDRIAYIKYLNDLILKNKNSTEVTSEIKFLNSKDLIEKYIEESFTVGLKPELIDEGKKICTTVMDFVHNNQELVDILKLLDDKNKDLYTHSFLTTFFSFLIIKNLRWASQRTVQAVALAALFHDIGKLKLKPELLEKSVPNMNKDELNEYQKHPQYGTEILEHVSGIGQATLQIIYQHHEYMDGTGFPNQLTLTKIYPLAKVVITSNLFARYMADNKLTAIEALRAFIPNKTEMIKHDPDIIKALILSFIKAKK